MPIGDWMLQPTVRANGTIGEMPRDEKPRRPMSQGVMSLSSMLQEETPQRSMSQGAMPLSSMVRDETPQDSVPRDEIPRGSMPRRPIHQGHMSRSEMPISSMLRDKSPQGPVPQDPMPQDQTAPQETHQGDPPQDPTSRAQFAHHLDSLMCRTSLCSCPEHIPSEAAIYGLMQHPKLTALNAAPILYRHYGIPTSPDEPNEMFAPSIPASERKEMFAQLWRLTRYGKDQRVCILRMLDLKFDDITLRAKRELREIQERWIHVTKRTAMERMEKEYEERFLLREGSRDRTVSPEREGSGGVSEGKNDTTVARNRERERDGSRESNRRDSAILMPPPPPPPSRAISSRPAPSSSSQVKSAAPPSRTKTPIPVDWDPLAPGTPPPNPAYNEFSWADFNAEKLLPGQLPVGFSDAYDIPRNVRSEAASESAEKRKAKRLEAENGNERENEGENGDGGKEKGKGKGQGQSNGKGKGKRACEGEHETPVAGNKSPPPPPPGASVGTGPGSTQGKGKGKAPAASKKRSRTSGNSTGNGKGKAQASEQEISNGQMTNSKSLIVTLKVNVPDELTQPETMEATPAPSPAPAPAPAATPAPSPQNKSRRARKQTKRVEQSKLVIVELDQALKRAVKA